VLASGILDPVLALLDNRSFLDQVDALGGYSVTETGRRLR